MHQMMMEMRGNGKQTFKCITNENFCKRKNHHNNNNGKMFIYILQEVSMQN